MGDGFSCSAWDTRFDGGGRLSVAGEGLVCFALLCFDGVTASHVVRYLFAVRKRCLVGGVLSYFALFLGGGGVCALFVCSVGEAK